MPLEDALKIALQIANALEAAHERNIVHRDLKPANIKITPEEKVKVLDFGLAKAFAPDVAAENAAAGPGDVSPSEAPTLPLSDSPALSPPLPHSPALSAAATRQGMILGTASYMSPEQARGKTVDKRADIWAFGCVVYEMLTGKPAFEGETITEILAGILRGEPDWQALPETTPPNIRTVLRRCLQKDVKRRFRDAADVAIEIEEALTAPATTQPAIPLPQARPGWRRAMP